MTQNETITEEGENVTMSCSASGTPPPMVAWIKVDSDKRFDGTELVFTHINRTQAGEYRCEASNECGIASETATIEVQCKYQFLAVNHLLMRHGQRVGKFMSNSLGLMDFAGGLVNSVLCFLIGKFKGNL